MKRPSEVPPEVESAQAMPACSRIEAASASLSSPGAVRKGSPPSVQAISKSRPCLRSSRSTRAFSDSGVDCGAEAEVEVDHHLARDHVARAGAGMDVRHLPATSAGSARCRGPSRCATSSASAGATQVDRVPRQVRVGDVALHAEDAQLAAEGAAPAVLDRVADALAPRSARRRCSSRGGCRARSASRRPARCRRSTGPSSSLVISRATPPRCAGRAATNSSAATTMAAIELFMSAAPRP